MTPGKSLVCLCVRKLFSRCKGFGADGGALLSLQMLLRYLLVHTFPGRKPLVARLQASVRGRSLWTLEFFPLSHRAFHCFRQEDKHPSSCVRGQGAHLFSTLGWLPAPVPRRPVKLARGLYVTPRAHSWSPSFSPAPSTPPPRPGTLSACGFQGLGPGPAHLSPVPPSPTASPYLLPPSGDDQVRCPGCRLDPPSPVCPQSRWGTCVDASADSGPTRLSPELSRSSQVVRISPGPPAQVSSTCSHPHLAEGSPLVQLLRLEPQVHRDPPFLNKCHCLCSQRASRA